jgi:ankyrin repeat protein
MCAIEAGMESLAFMLIRYGADINLRDDYLNSTLHLAVQAHSYAICKKLLEMNQDLINIGNKNCVTPIWYIIPEIKKQKPNDNDFRIFDLLLKNGANLLFNSPRTTPLDLIKANEKHYKNNLLQYIKTNYPNIPLSNNIS